MREGQCGPPLRTIADTVLRIRASRRRCCVLSLVPKTLSAPLSHLDLQVCLLLEMFGVGKSQFSAALPLRRKLCNSGD